MIYFVAIGNLLPQIAMLCFTVIATIVGWQSIRIEAISLYFITGGIAIIFHAIHIVEGLKSAAKQIQQFREMQKGNH